MSVIRVEIDDQEINRFREMLSNMPRKFDMAMKRAKTRAHNILASEMAKNITAHYYVKKSEVMKSMTRSQTRDSIEILLRGARRTLRTYKMSPSRAPKKRKASGYLKGAVKREGGLKSIGNGFVLNGLPMQRKAPGRHGTWQGLKIVYGPSIAQLADNEEVLPGVIEKAESGLMQQLRYWSGQALKK